MKKILIIEDDKVVAAAYKQRFMEAGYAVDHALDGLEGIKLVTAVKPDLILLDLLMPRLDGIEVLKFIRSHPEINHLPVVVFSNSFMTNLVEAAWRAGADQCLMKASTTPTQLFDAVRKAMDKAAMRRPNPNVTPTMVPPIDPLMRASSPMPIPKAAPTPAAPSRGPAAAPAPAPATSGKPALFTPQEKSAVQPQPQADPEFQAQIRQLFINSSTPKLGSIRSLATTFVQGDSPVQQSALLTELFRKIHSMTGNAAIAGCRQIAEFAGTFEALLQELVQQPAFVNVSTRRSVAKSVDFIETLFQSAGRIEIVVSADGPVLVLEPDAAAARTIQQTLAQADLKSEVSVDAAESLGLMASGPFSLVVLPADLPGLSGFELFAQIQALPGHRFTPALFTTGFENFAQHSNPELLGDSDLLAKPCLPIELILKSVMGVQRSRLA